jgi:hypothetical protein
MVFPRVLQLPVFRGCCNDHWNSPLWGDFSVKEELFINGVSKGVATPGFQGVLQRSLELA